MCKMKIKSAIILSLFLAFFLSNNLYAQKKKSKDKLGALTLEEALKINPNEVYKLDLSKQKLTSFPIEVLNFKNLVYLDLSRNRITKLPENIDLLQSLNYLNISSNRITELPANIVNIKTLSSLKIGFNKIKTLPSNFSSLNSLVILEVYSNPLHFDPQIFSSMASSLKYLNVQNTELSREECNELEKILPNTRLKYDKSCNCH